ncbi:MAG: queuosine precursor transporter [Myxococcota bacterium]
MSDDAPLPTAQHAYEGLPALSVAELHRRRELVFLALSGLFLGTLAMLNILGVSRFIDLSFEVFGMTVPMPLAVGVLPYPVTFLCTDLLSELYGRRRTSAVVWTGLGLNLWVMLILWLGGALPGFEAPGEEGTGVYYEVQKLAFSAVTASMIAYLAAQFVDVHLFHFWKTLTKGKHLWLRNNGSTLVSQLVDTTSVILITHFLAGALPIDPDAPLWGQLFTFIASGYVFKLATALFDTLPFYGTTRLLERWLRLPPAGTEPVPTEVAAGPAT